MTKQYRIRRCTGNKGCWTLVALDAAGNEMTSYGSYTTSHSLDLLLKFAGHLQPKPGDQVELVT